MKVIVTGASGFIGSYLLPVLAAREFEVFAAGRKPLDFPGVNWRQAPELGPGSDWSRVLRNADAVVHLAGHAPIRRDGSNEEDLCRRLNAEGTRRLAQEAVACGVRHFVFVSSCHAVAAESDALLTAETAPHPSSAYGRSKLAAEEAVRQELNETACAWTILRPPAVYGPGHESNFTRLAKLAFSGVPLPLASVGNRRSFIYAGNLADIIVKCLDDAKARGNLYYPSDGEDVSTPELIRAIARANDVVRCPVSGASASNRATRHSPWLFPFPEKVLRATGRLPGMGALRKLTSSLYVDSEPLRRELGWTAPFTLEQALRQ